jgi:hypothetical protein
MIINNKSFILYGQHSGVVVVYKHVCTHMSQTTNKMQNYAIKKCDGTRFECYANNDLIPCMLSSRLVDVVVGVFI